jgi:hypothetical protein
LLNDNAALLHHLQTMGSSQSTTTSCLREMKYSTSLACCFPSMFSAFTTDNKLDLTAYAQNILLLAKRHGDTEWLCLFHQQKAASAGGTWADLNPSLLASTVMSQPSPQGKLCKLRSGVDHTNQNCVIYPIMVPAPPSSSSLSVGINQPPVRRQNPTSGPSTADISIIIHVQKRDGYTAISASIALVTIHVILFS